MTKSILTIVKNELKDIICLPCERVNLDVEQFNEYTDSIEHPVEKPFETPTPQYQRKFVDQISENNWSTILKYFLDGSRRTYKIADLIIDGKYLPLIAGQVGVAILERNNEQKKLFPIREYCEFKNILAFPKPKITPGDLIDITKKINEISKIKFDCVGYLVKEEKNPIDLGIAKIMSEMQDLEISMVLQMARKNILREHHMLVIDGPLRFVKTFDDITQFRNVIGISKTFRPSFTVGKGRRQVDVGTITSGLQQFERTSVFKAEIGDKTIGMWYLRIRQPKYMTNPLQGIVKIECYATSDYEIENGFSPDRIDNISAQIIRERNVTPYEKDLRWASHIYPIYSTEMFIKSSMVSDIQFMYRF